MKFVLRCVGWAVFLVLVVNRGTYAQQEPLTLSLVPVGGSSVEGAQSVALEIFVTVNRNIRLEGGQVDLPCSLSGGSSGAIQFVSGNTDPDGDGARGPSQSGVPFLFGPVGLGIVNPTTCVIAATPPIQGTPQSFSAGDTRYLATFVYRVSDCAAGEFALGVEGRNLPPTNGDSTRFREDEPPGQGFGPVVPLRVTASPLQVQTGRCCRGSSCLGDFSEFCCQTVHEGTHWDADRSCPLGCPCKQIADCQDDNSCTLDSCQAGVCIHSPVLDGTACDDGQFCSTQSSCMSGACTGSGDACPGRRCHEESNACVDCLEDAHCADTNPCTDDRCNAQGRCTHPFNTAPCDDGRFCTEDDTCTRSRCVGTDTVCTGRFCNETLQRCDQCETDAHCNDEIEQTKDACVDGQCIHESAHRVLLSLVPVGGTSVDGGIVVRVEALLTALANVRIDGGQVDVPCTLSGGASGTVLSHGVTTDPDGDGSRGPSFNGVPYLFGPTGGGSVDARLCRVAFSPAVGSDGLFLTVGQVRYLATFDYAVSDCAAGEFMVSFEGAADPPTPGDRTRIHEDEPIGPALGPLIPLALSPTVLDVSTGRCCRGGACLGELNEHCCRVVGGGETWDASSTCNDGCLCESGADCDDENGCTTDLCLGGTCAYRAVNDGTPCHDGLFCTTLETCQAGVCQGGTPRCIAPAALCDEKHDRCVECRKHVDCEDGNECTTDRCDVAAGICAYENNRKPCNDGLFCTKPDRCTDGVCVGEPRHCSAGNVCDESSDRCVPGR